VSDRPHPNLPDDERPAEPDDDTDATEQLFTLARPSELVPEEFRDVSFRPAIGGYSRRDVDAYVKSVNQAIAELEISRSPEKAVKLALDRVAEQTAGVLQEAGEAAEKLKAEALAESEHAARRAQVEADELRERAESESSALIERSQEQSAELLDAAEAQLEDLHRAIGEARAEYANVLGRLRATAASLDAFATEAARAEAPESRRSVTEADGPDRAGEQETETMDAVELDGDEQSDGDSGGGAPRAAMRRRITDSRKPRVPKREPAGSGRTQRAD
jgi:cell division septum initiation protein DivIVA